MEDKEGKVWVQVEVKVRVKAGEWVVQVKGQARALAGNAYARSAGQGFLTREVPLVLNIPAPSANQR